MQEETFQEYDKYGIIDDGKTSVELFVSIDTSQKDDVTHSLESESVFTDTDIDPNNVFGSIMDQCKDIGERIHVHPLLAYMLLETQNWNKHKLYENFSQIATTMLAQVGISPEQVMDDPSIQQLDGDEIVECDICYKDFPRKQFLALPCGHAFCFDCWKEHVSTHVSSAKLQIPCPADGCSRRLPPTSVELICGKEIYANALKFIMDTQVSLADTLTICPNPTCSRPINALQTGPCNVLKCSCGYEFCTLCNQESHAPSTCSVKDQWGLLTGDEIMKKRLFGPNVKPCPNCKVVIEKNGGCNHMTCQKCRHEFCWMCFAPWNTHPKDYYNCANYKKENDPYLKPVDNINKELLSIYHDPFTKDQYNAKLYKDKKKQYVKALVDIASRNATSIDRNYLTNKANELLDQLYYAVLNIQWSQPHMFFLKYAKVQNLPVNDQTKKVEETSQEKLFKMAFNDLNEVVKKIGNTVQQSLTTKGNAINLKDIEKMVKQLKVYRSTLLKQVDPHYHINFKK